MPRALEPMTAARTGREPPHRPCPRSYESLLTHLRTALATRAVCDSGAMPIQSPLASLQHLVVLMLENRSFDHMLGFLYAANGNVSPSGVVLDGLTGTESNPAPLDSHGTGCHLVTQTGIGGPKLLGIQPVPLNAVAQCGRLRSALQNCRDRDARS